MPPADHIPGSGPFSPPPPPVPHRLDAASTIRGVQLANEAVERCKYKCHGPAPVKPTPPEIQLLCSWCMKSKCGCRMFCRVMAGLLVGGLLVDAIALAAYLLRETP
jgi:hypothetical protein